MEVGVRIFASSGLQSDFPSLPAGIDDWFQRASVFLIALPHLGSCLACVETSASGVLYLPISPPPTASPEPKAFESAPRPPQIQRGRSGKQRLQLPLWITSTYPTYLTLWLGSLSPEREESGCVTLLSSLPIPLLSTSQRSKQRQLLDTCLLIPAMV